MAQNGLGLTRNQLAEFLKTHEQIKQFEQLFEVADAVSNDSDTESIRLQADSASAVANEALSLIKSIAQDAAINSVSAEQKAVQALNDIAKIAQIADLVAAMPAVQNNNSLKTDYVDFDLYSPHADKIGRVSWGDDNKTLQLGMDYSVVQNIGQVLYARVENNTGVTLSKGALVYALGAGATGESVDVAKYIADGTIDGGYIIGVMAHDLPDSGTNGYCTTRGIVSGIDTSAWSVGDFLYASPSVAGGLTNVKPTAPNSVALTAIVITSNATTGAIYVNQIIEQHKHYGEFAKTSDQTPAAINTEYLLTFDSSLVELGVSIGATTSQIIVHLSGLYNFDASIQLTSGSAAAKNVWFWFKKNGTAVANSARLVTVDINGGYVSINLSMFFNLAANDYVEIAFASDDINVTIDNVASTAFAPAAPAVLLSVTQIQQ